MESKIAICITTYNRPEAIMKSLPEHYRYKPEGAKLIIVQDYSKQIISHADYTFHKRVGIPTAKNKCLEIAMQHQAEHIFLFDDDTYPIEEDWHLPYINSKHPHLCYSFGSDRYLDKDKEHWRHALGNGCMMYVHRSVVERIGGFDTNFGLGKYEHPQFSFRAFNAGLIPYPFLMPKTDTKQLFCMDELNQVERTLNKQERSDLIKSGYDHFLKTRTTDMFIPYY